MNEISPRKFLMKPAIVKVVNLKIKITACKRNPEAQLLDWSP
jgi:hypothetical protein